ncbi:autotransporter adhesin family protein [Marivita sp. S6314]|uniref:autotransporter adhesin family protein n=1 Tax=Marivita sp. S6314 TaxID=2926406 RepID=UPI001FF5D407|nr:autotransporter adhesin family protein [Marivita sp. S6314]MCK0150426.1 autotransporter adhesin family protein [Marivita sp. S6314]
MTALTKDRNTPERMGWYRSGTVAANVNIHNGSLLMRDANGDIKPGASETGSVGLGRAESSANNTGGQAGDLTVNYRPGIFAFDNSAGADLIGTSHVGKLCYIVDDQTVAATDDTGARSPAGFVDEVDGSQVWVRFDEAITGIA